MGKKIIKLTVTQINNGNRLIAEFMGYKQSGKKGNYTNIFINEQQDVHHIKELNYHQSWDKIMPVIDKLYSIKVYVDITNHHSKIAWWYSKKKNTTFKGNSCGKWKERREPFDSIGGDFHSLAVGVGETAEKINTGTKIEATYYNVVYFLTWHKTNVK